MMMMMVTIMVMITVAVKSIITRPNRYIYDDYTKLKYGRRRERGSLKIEFVYGHKINGTVYTFAKI